MCFSVFSTYYLLLLYFFFKLQFWTQSNRVGCWLNDEIMTSSDVFSPKVDVDMSVFVGSTGSLKLWGHRPETGHESCFEEERSSCLDVGGGSPHSHWGERGAMFFHVFLRGWCSAIM